MRQTTHPATPAEALAVIRPLVRRTPVMRSDALDQLSGSRLWFKCEHLQHTGSFKLRGASFAVARLPDDVRGVATHSSGNHGAALAAAAHRRGLACDVVMPENAVASKVEAVRAHGGTVHFCAPTQAAREAGLAELVAGGRVAIPPYDHDDIIAGQGTCAVEFIAQQPRLDCVIAPIGGGGLLAGTVRAAAQHRPGLEVVGAEPAGADDAARSLTEGRRVADHRPETVADGLRALIGMRNFAILHAAGTAVITVQETAIFEAMRLIWQHMKQVVEPSGAVPLAALLTDPERFRGRQVGLVLSGGNLDVRRLIEPLEENHD